MNTIESQRARLKAVLHECSVHAERIAYAREMCAPLFPLDAEAYSKLDAKAIQQLDQLVYRFTKLQDALGAKLFPLLTAELREDAVTLTVLDRLAALEKAGAVPSADEWLELREVRNQLAHDYHDDPENGAEYLNDLYRSSERLLVYNDQVRAFVHDRVLHDSTE